MSVQDATPLGVKLYIIVPIVIFKKLGGITSYCRPQQSKPGSKHIIAATLMSFTNISIIYFISLDKSNSIHFCYFLN